MSFKREGDDQCQLNVLKKRRVADLLSNFIPDDEATLMKNGRYSCLVCSHRPVFDTVDMLMVHRKGKRHLEGMKWFYGKKNDMQREIDKRRHQDYVKTEDERQGQTEGKGVTKKKKNGSRNVCEPITEERRRELEHYLKLKSSGWLQDRSGKWVKDENVEFDSDEEEPDLLPPCSESS
ncbi:sodium channel modifier 1 isoform X1 [Labeo rohita]|uniref:Sodium channel modifier 1 n=1 Tax=Labeo rohita TaxID=84645 RepID=A0A498NII4_LABRO|nr:sodium channel modifier 1 isoform X1 [Labeo rohita]